MYNLRELIHCSQHYQAFSSPRKRQPLASSTSCTPRWSPVLAGSSVVRKEQSTSLTAAQEQSWQACRLTQRCFQRVIPSHLIHRVNTGGQYH